MNRLRIQTDGTSLGTRILDEHGNEIHGVRSVSFDIGARRRTDARLVAYADAELDVEFPHEHIRLTIEEIDRERVSLDEAVEALEMIRDNTSPGMVVRTIAEDTLASIEQRTAATA